MKKQFISKVLAVVMAFSFLGMATEASAATIETKTITEDSEDKNYDPLSIRDLRLSTDNKVNKSFQASVYTNGGKGDLNFYYLILKDGQKVYEKSTDYFFSYWTPRETGNYTIYVEVRSTSGERVTATKDFTVGESGVELTAPANLEFREYSHNTVRLTWEPSISKNCKVSVYYIIIDGAAVKVPSYQQFYDYELDDQMHTVYVVAVSEDGAQDIYSPDSNTVIIPAMK